MTAPAPIPAPDGRLAALPPYLNASWVAWILGIGVPAARKRLAAGCYGPVIRDGRRCYVALEAFCEAMEAKAEPREDADAVPSREGRELLRVMRAGRRAGR